MKTIIVGFSKAKSKWMVGSALIMWFTWRPFSHVYFKFKEDLYDDWTVDQSTGHGIGYMSQIGFDQNNLTVKEFALEISDELYVEILRTCHMNSGVKYGYLQNIGIFLVDCLSKVGIKVNKNPLPIGINCSEWMYYILEEIYGKWTEKDPALIKPGDVYDFLLLKEFNK